MPHTEKEKPRSMERSLRTVVLTPDILKQVARDQITRENAEAYKPLIAELVASYRNIYPVSVDETDRKVQESVQKLLSKWSYTGSTMHRRVTYELDITFDMQKYQTHQFMRLLESWLTASRHFSSLEQDLR